jgi:hypothetical protein
MQLPLRSSVTTSSGKMSTSTPSPTVLDSPEWKSSMWAVKETVSPPIGRVRIPKHERSGGPSGIRSPFVSTAAGRCANMPDHATVRHPAIGCGSTAVALAGIGWPNGTGVEDPGLGAGWDCEGRAEKQQAERLDRGTRVPRPSRLPGMAAVSHADASRIRAS